MATRRPERSAAPRAFEQALLQTLRNRARLVTGVQADAAKRLKTLAGAMAALLAEQPAEWQQWQITDIQRQVQALIEGLEGDLTPAVDTALQTAWSLGQAAVDGPLAAASVQVEMYLPQLNPTVLTALRSFTAGRIKDLAAQAAGAVDQAIHLTVLGAQTPGQAINQVKAALGGTDAATVQRARRIVNTSLGEAYAVAQQQRMEQSAELVPGLRKQWLRSGKIHSRWNHDAMDGVSVPVKEHFKVPTKGLGVFVKMLHPHDPKAPPGEVINCGCVARPWLDRWGLKPGTGPFSDREKELNPMKKASDAWLQGRLRG